MARDNDKGLYLPLRIDLDAWEQSLMTADADLRKAMREMNSAVKDLKFRYSVEIEGAKASGDYLKAVELETAQTNQLLEIQGKIVDALAKKYENLSDKGTKEAVSVERKLLEQQKVLYQLQNKVQSVKDAEARNLAETKKKFENAMFNATASDYDKALRRITEEKNEFIKNGIEKVNAEKLFAIQKEEINKKYLAEIKNAQEKLSIGDVFGSRLAEALERNFPVIGRFKGVINSLNADFEKLGYSSKILISSLKGFGAVGAALYGAYKIGKSVTENMAEAANMAKEAAEPILQLQKLTNETYEETERLHAIFAITGKDASAFVGDIQQMYRSSQRNANGMNLINKTLARYGANITDSQKKLKGMREILNELSRAYNTARKAGEENQFLAGLGGAFTRNEYTGILRDFEKLSAIADSTVIKTDKEYKSLKELKLVQREAAEAARQLAIEKGKLYSPEEVEIVKLQTDGYKALAKYMDDTKESTKEVIGLQKDIALFWVDVNTGFTMFVEQTKNKIAEMYQSVKKYKEENPSVFENIKKALKSRPITRGIVETAEWFFDLAKSGNEARDSITKARKAQEEFNKAAKDDNDKPVNPLRDLDKEKQEAEEAKKLAEAKKKFQDALFEAQASEYEKQIKRITDEKDAFIAAKIDEADAEKLFAIKKAAIDKEYYEKAKKEQDNLSKKIQEDYKKQIEASKKAKEEALSQAEQTLRSNVKLIRYMDKIRKQGGDYEAAGRQYAEKLYYKQNGFRASDIGLLRDFGVQFVKEIANVRDRVFADFAPAGNVNNVTNNNTVNIERPILTDENLVTQLTEKIFDKLAPFFRQPISNNSL